MKTKLLLLSTILFSICNVNAATYLFKIQDTNVSNAIIIDKEEPITPERVFIPVTAGNAGSINGAGYYEGMTCEYDYGDNLIEITRAGGKVLYIDPTPYFSFSTDSNGKVFFYKDENSLGYYNDIEIKYYIGQFRDEWNGGDFNSFEVCY